jgi:hypothetical protein
MGSYTHFKKLAGVESIAVGKKGYEKEIVKEDGTVTANVEGNVSGYALKSVAVTATATTGTQIPAGATHVAVTSANANNIVILPAPVVGLKITLLNGATGYELRSSAPATIAINGGTGADAESAVAANITVEVTCVSATAWIGSTYTTAGVVGVLQVAAP